MDKFATLEPVRLYTSSSISWTSSSKATTLRSRQSVVGNGQAPFELIGRLPVDLHILILTHLAIPDLPSYALTSRRLSQLARDERVWKPRWSAFGIEQHRLVDVLDTLELRTNVQGKQHTPPTLPVESLDDDFGDFAAVNTKPDELGDFVGAFSAAAITSFVPASPRPDSPIKQSYRALYMRAHAILRPLLPALSQPPHAVLSILFPAPPPPLQHQAHLLRLLSLFLSPHVQPVRVWSTLSSVLHAAIDRFADGLLNAFDVADGKGDERGMREAASASWEVLDEGVLELGRVWVEKREIFYEQDLWRPLDNFTDDDELNFDAMDGFMTHILEVLAEHGARAVRVFPPASGVLLSFAERLASEVVGEYIAPLLTRAREISPTIFLKATAATFRESWRLVDTLFEVASLHSANSDAQISSRDLVETHLTKTQAEDVVYRMFEMNMDEYLDEEIESVKQAFETTCHTWESQLAAPTLPSNGAQATANATRFLASQNPAQVKRTVLASFTSVLLLPVTIVPRVGAVLTTGGTAAAQGIARLNPQRWGSGIGSSSGWGAGRSDGYMQDFAKGGEGTLFEIGADEDDENEKSVVDEKTSVRDSIASTLSTRTSTTVDSTVASSRVTSLSAPVSVPLASLELLLSLDVALELIHADRESLARVETFAGYPGQYGHRVRDTIEELFVLLMQALGERHMRTGFEHATEQMRTYRPAEHEATESITPLLQFFELVHVGDMMQSMVQVYFDKELASHIDKTDFLNTVVREKKRFEDLLDDCVAAGLNAGTDALMNQVEYIILTLTKPREYYPLDDTPLDLGPTEGCKTAIKCLQMHCQLLKGSTSKEVLEVFYQEVGIRLIAILQKHIKRQIISLTGGFQIIADLNAYYTFISSLKVASIAAEFSYLKMLGHVYVVEDAKDLAQIVRDVTRYGGAYRPEDVYEFIQRRSDWKKIEKIVDKTMYNLSFKEDCTVC